MKARSKGRRAIWVRVAIVGALIALHALESGSANAASLGPRPHQAARIAAAGNPSTTSSIVLAGFTSQNYPAFFKISGNGRMLVASGIALDMHCTSGGEFVLPDLFVRVPIGVKGKLNAAYSQPPTAGANGSTYTGSDSLTGKLGPKHSQLSGVWQLSVHYSFTNGMNDQCDSGPVRFAAAG